MFKLALVAATSWFNTPNHQPLPLGHDPTVVSGRVSLKIALPLGHLRTSKEEWSFDSTRHSTWIQTFCKSSFVEQTSLNVHFWLTELFTKPPFQIQTHERFRIMLSVRTKHNMRIFGANPLYRATKRHLNNNLTVKKIKNLLKRWGASPLIFFVWGAVGGAWAMFSAWKNVGMTMTCNGSDVTVI